MNTPVKFELAKLLKEKRLYNMLTTHVYDLQEECHSLDGYPDYLHKKEINWTFAPTIAEVVMWLHEKHGIWIYVKKDWDLGKCLGFEGVIDTNDGFINTETYNSLTEAYEASIEYTLKDIIK